MKILKWLREAVHRKKAWTLAQILDCSPCQYSNSQGAVRSSSFWLKRAITGMEHLPYYADLAPNDFWLFPKRN
jgi:hypothetical protein